jgi:microcystin-dependent protein
MYAGNVAPTGWLICDGTLVSSSTYAALYAALNSGAMWGQTGGNFNLPDFRGVFPRGANNMGGSAGDAADAFSDPDKAGRGTPRYTGGATGNAMGSYQQDQIVAHTHSSFVGAQTASSGGGDATMTVGSTGSTGGNETRAKNAYIMFLIKY